MNIGIILSKFKFNNSPNILPRRIVSRLAAR
jgi:hypothetical protein